MFKKVQLKFFAIITSILLALFIGVLVSINLIMEAVMQRQSKVVLKQIASSIEYDEKTETFIYNPEPGGKKAPQDERQPGDGSKDPPNDDKSQTNVQTDPEIPEEEPETTASESDTKESQAEASSEESTVAAENENTTENFQTEPTDAAITSENPTSARTEPPEQNTAQPPAVTEAPVESPQQTYPDFPPGPEDGPPPDEPFQPWDGDRPDWKEPHEYEPGSNGFPDYPLPDFRDHRYDEYAEPESFFSGIGFDGIADPLAADQVKPLKEYTIITNAPRTVWTAESNAAKRGNIPVPKSMGSIEFFVIMADKNGNFLASLNNDELDSSVAQQYVSAIIKNKASSGMLNSYQFCRLDKSNGTVMVFTDKSAELDMLDQLMHTTILIGIISFVLLSVLALFLSKKSIQPIKIAFEKQKQFVSDASHELKTPLTIISANADVLADEIGENKWLTYIKAQTERMNVLVNDLLNLTRLENNASDFICSEFDLSKAIENTALPFECQAFEDNKAFDIDIQEGLTINGSERHIKQMTAIFIDNALKYSNDGGTVRITLSAQGDKKILSVFNTGCGIRDDEKNKIFERFYRSDDSRARTTGGYGLGLAIAKSIIDKHKFKITVDNLEGVSICFNVIM